MPMTPPRREVHSEDGVPEWMEPFHALVIDDEPAIHRLFQADPLFKDWHIDFASSITEAEAKLEKNGHQVVITDYRLPDAEKYGGVIKWAATRYGLPIVVFSGFVTSETYLQFTAEGASAVISKGDWHPAAWEIRQAVEAAWNKFQVKLDRLGRMRLRDKIKAHIAETRKSETRDRGPE